MLDSAPLHTPRSVSLYIHIPWCIRKCPYCDFNSHQAALGEFPEKSYVQALIEDFKTDKSIFGLTHLHSIFIGGGTPSLFSAQAYEELFDALNRLVHFEDNIEITLEANPGTIDESHFYDYRKVGINRLSLGIQSFNPMHLKSLGRIHDDTQAHRAITLAQKAGFDNFNIDLMHGLPKQTIQEGLEDLDKAISYDPSHISWYQLTIEPNTVFYKYPPPLPEDDLAFELEQQGFERLKDARYQHYEISAFAKSQRFSQHNLNYWLFGDYLGIGAGAHGKYTMNNQIYRTEKYRQPKDYLNPDKPYLCEKKLLTQKDIIFEFMLNVCRLNRPITFRQFEETTFLPIKTLMSFLMQASEQGWINLLNTSWELTAKGRRFTNELLLLFL